MERQELVQISRADRVTEEEFYPAINKMYETIWENLMPQQIPTDELSSTVRNNVITPADEPVPDCLACGACCASMICVGVRPGEEKALETADYWEIVTESDSEVVVDRYVKRDPKTLACTALEGELGKHSTCRIYENRPSMCHHFEAGSDRCHALRRAYGIEPFLALDEMMDALKKLRCRPAGTPDSETIRNAKIEKDDGSDLLKISVLLKNGDLVPIHLYDPNRETWLQFEFDGYTLKEAGELINSRSDAI